MCGRIRFSFDQKPLWVAHCHCRSCRRNTGASLATFVGVSDTAFQWSGEAASVYKSSPGVRRSFCPHCGGALTYEADRYPGEVHINIGALDRPEGFVPTLHVWTEAALPWLHVQDQARRFAQMPQPKQ